jgi:hypothetical protein
VDLLDVYSLVLGYVLPRVVDVRCCAELAVGLLNFLHCGCRFTNSASCLIQYVLDTLLEKKP